ncbi:MAG: PAP/fibrillin family protein [Microcystaceae cyanobacterium]
MLTRDRLKQELLALIEPFQTRKQGSPITNLRAKPDTAQAIEKLTEQLEAVNPHLFPLLYCPQLLDGIWWLNYSTAREIRSLDKLPLGFQVGRVYQVIDVASQAFFNQAFVKHPLGLVQGYVQVTATFEIARSPDSPLPDKRLNVQFLERSTAISAIAGFKTPSLEPVNTASARGPQGRIPTLDITYLDETLRIGRGGEGSLFILSKVDQIQP